MDIFTSVANGKVTRRLLKTQRLTIALHFKFQTNDASTKIADPKEIYCAEIERTTFITFHECAETFTLNYNTQRNCDKEEHVLCTSCEIVKLLGY